MTGSAEGQAGGEQQVAASRGKLVDGGLLPGLLRLALDAGVVAVVAVRARALLCTAALVRGHGAGQTALAQAVVRRGGAQLPALHAALLVALNSSVAAEAAAAEAVVAAFCDGNPDGQVALASTLQAPSSGKSII